MKKENCVDVKTAVFLKRILNYYIKKRTYNKPPPTEEEVWEALFVDQTNIIYDLCADVKIILHKDSRLCRLIYFGFEENELNFMKKYLRNGDVFIDIGSNIGLYSLIASSFIGKEGSIYAIEPTPETFSRLKKNIALNNFKNINTLNFGLSNSENVVDFNTSNDGYDAWNSLAKLDQLKKGAKIKINVKTLDSVLDKNSITKVDLVKLDVEGWEKYVLEGASNLLNHADPPVFMVEFTESNAFVAGYYLGELYDYMTSYGFKWYSYDKANNKLNFELKKLHYPYENLIAIKDYEKCVQRLKI